MASSPPVAGAFLLATAVLSVSKLPQGYSSPVEDDCRDESSKIVTRKGDSPSLHGVQSRHRSTYLNCFVKSSSTSSSSQLSCQSGSAFPPDALFSESSTLPDCSAIRQLILSTFQSSTHRPEGPGRHTSCGEVLIISVDQKRKGKGCTSNSSSSSKAPNWGNFFFSPSGFFSVDGAPTSPATFSFDCCWSLLVSDIML